MESAIKFIKLLLTLILVIHIIACIYISIGDLSSGWLSITIDYDNQADKFSTYYVTSFYMIVTTFTTVGYGEYYPLSINEMVYIMFAQLLGIAIFSNIVGAITSIKSQKSAMEIINEKKANTESFLDQISEGMQPKGLPEEYYLTSLKYLDAEYNFGTQHIINLKGFYQILKPRIKIWLVNYVLETVYTQFQHFFFDECLPFVSDDRFVIEVLSNLKCKVFESQELVLKAGHKCKNLYFIRKGSIFVKNENN